ncbi:MAG TPA: zinc ribbon domain-containing protein [Candidatus Acidoferrum sp.]|nr:zinc ribbon domain-containing protein [Candidatus Acidoferrum sp.]
MFCSACGAQIQPQFTVCPNCRQPIPATVAIALPGRLDRHLRVLGILWVVAGALFVIPGFVLMTLSGVVRLALPAAETVGRFLAPLVLSIIGGSLFIVAAGGIVVGWGLLKHQPWARVAAIVLGIVSLLHPPFGTALGIYTLWVLLSDQGGAEYGRLAHAT